MATLRMMKKPWLVALAQVPASTWFERMVWKLTPSRYHFRVSGLVLRSQSTVYVWKPAWQEVGEQTRWAPMPFFSPQGPPGLVPQWKVPHSLLMPWTFSMMSISPTPGQFHQLPRYGAPSIQNAGQYPRAPAPVMLGICNRASTRSFPPAGGWKSARLVSIRPEVQLPAPSRCGVIRRLPPPSRDTLAVLA